MYICDSILVSRVLACSFHHQTRFDTSSKLSTTLFIMCRFLKGWHVARYPVGNPINHPGQRNDGVSIKTLRGERVVVPPGLCLFTFEDWFFTEAAAEFVCGHSDAHLFRAAHIQSCRWRGRMCEQPKDLGIAVALPDDRGIGSADRNRFAVADPLCDVVQHSVAHVDGVIEPGQATGCALAAREIREHPLPPDAARCVVAGGPRLDALIPTTTANRGEGINTERGESDDPRRLVTLGHESRNMCIHRPSEARILPDTEFLPGHVHDIGHVGQGSDGIALQQITDDGFDVPAFQPSSQVLLGEPCHADDAFGRHRTLSHAGDRRPNLAAYPKEHNVPLHASEKFGQPCRRSR